MTIHVIKFSEIKVLRNVILNNYHVITTLFLTSR